MSLLIKGKFIRLEHGESIKILNATGTQTLDLIKINNNDRVEVLGDEVALKAEVDAALTSIAGAAQAALQAETEARVDADNAFEARIGAAATQEAGGPVVPGIASLGLDGKIPSSQMPALALTDVRVVTTIAERDALVVQEGFEEGDVAVVTAAVEIPEGSGQFFPRTYIRGDSSWIEISSGSDVTSVNGETGAVVLTAGDIDLETANPVNPVFAATTVQGALEELDAELNDTQLGAGLASDGSYIIPEGSSYLDETVSLADADSKLDVAIQAVEDELDTTQVGAGLGEDGSYSTHESSNYITSDDFATATLTESLHNADKLLDAAVKSVSDALNAHLVDTADAHDASAISFEPAREEPAGVPAIPTAGALTATTVQAAIEELASVIHEKEKHVLVQADIDNGYVDLEQEAMEKSVVASVGRLMIQEGDDYTLTVQSGVTRLTFTGDLIEPGQEKLAAGDVIYVKYMYKA